MTSGTITPRECVAELARQYAGWCECGYFINRALIRPDEMLCCPGCQRLLDDRGILPVTDPRVFAVIDAVQGAESRLERRRSTTAAIEGHFARVSGELIR